MKMKIKDLKNRQINKICKKYICKNCLECPLKRFKDNRLVQCYRKARAYYYMNQEWIKIADNLTEEEKEQYKETIKTNIEKIENEEIEIKEQDL